MSVILVEGESDRAALEIVATRLGVRLPAIETINGASGVRSAAAAHRDEPLIGLVDANEQDEFHAVMPQVFVCDPDLEGELVRALGADEVVAVIAAQGELASFRRLQNQPAHRGRSVESQLQRFFSGRSGNKLRYARLLTATIPLERLPRPLTDAVRAAAREDAERDVRAAAERRASALAAGDEGALRALLHPDFGWTSHTGEQFDRESYLASNIGGRNVWHAQALEGVSVTVAGDTAVLRCTVTDDVTTADGRDRFRMPMTQTWVRSTDGWRCLAGHAGPRVLQS